YGTGADSTGFGAGRRGAGQRLRVAQRLSGGVLEDVWPAAGPMPRGGLRGDGPAGKPGGAAPGGGAGRRRVPTGVHRPSRARRAASDATATVWHRPGAGPASAPGATAGGIGGVFRGEPD